jgi:hypothetical protein
MKTSNARGRAVAMLAVLSFAAFAVAAPPAAAQTKTFVACPNGFPCPPLTIWGYIDAVGNTTMPWVALFHVPADICASFQVLQSDGSKMMTAIRPDGGTTTVSGSGSIGITISDTAPGWYAVHVTSILPAREQIFEFKHELLPLGCI